MKTCFIIDDELSAIHILDEYVSITPGIEVYGCFQSPLTALEKLHEGLVPDVIFLDINMPKLSGIQMVQLIPKTVKIIFTTAYSKFAVTAFDCNAFDYLLKPISYERFLICINKLFANQQFPDHDPVNDHFFIQSESKGKMIRINKSDLIFAESLQNYLHIHLANTTYKTYLTMGELENYLSGDIFARTHKSYLINLNKIISVEKNRISLENGHLVVLGDSYKDNFLKNLKNKLLKTTRVYCM